MNTGLGQLNFEGKDKVQVVIDRFRAFQPPEGYFLAFGGGKDSVVLYDLAVKAGVDFDAHYSITGIDPPELVQFIRGHYPDLIYEKPKERIWSLVERKGLPRRNARFCCEYLKEHTGGGRIVATGIRWAESTRRKRRSMVESCRWVKAKSFFHPIIDWTTSDVWEYIKRENLPYCSLYDEGFHRLGCVLCPMTSAKQAEREMARWPKLADAWLRAARRFHAKGSVGVQRWETAEDMFEWWLSRKASGKKDDMQPQMGMREGTCEEAK